jgi:hypothetical protein
MNRRLFATLLLIALAVVIGQHLWLDRDPIGPPAASASPPAPRPVAMTPAAAPPAFVASRFETKEDVAPASVAPVADAGWSATVTTDPETARQRIRAGNRINVDHLYGKFFALAGFSPEQQEKFVGNRLDLKDEVSRLFKASAKNAAGRDRDGHQLTLDVIREQVRAEYDEKLLAEWGSDTFEAFKRFDAERVLRNMTGQLEQVLARSIEPLSNLQNERLVSLLALSAASSGRIDFGAVDLERAITAAREFMTERQLAALRPLLEGRIASARERNIPPASAGETALPRE